MAMDLYAEAVRCADRMPPPGVQVLVWIYDPDPRDCHWAIGDYNQDAIISRRNTNGWETMDDLSKYRTITHWAVLPPPPAEAAP